MRCESLNIFLSICADKDLEIMQVDVKQAYLYSDLKEEVFMRIPQGMEIKEGYNPKEYCLKVKKELYGLPQAAHEWNKWFDMC